MSAAWGQSRGWVWVPGAGTHLGRQATGSGSDAAKGRTAGQRELPIPRPAPGQGRGSRLRFPLPAASARPRRNSFAGRVRQCLALGPIWLLFKLQSFRKEQFSDVFMQMHRSTLRLSLSMANGPTKALSLVAPVTRPGKATSARISTPWCSPLFAHLDRVKGNVKQKHQ